MHLTGWGESAHFTYTLTKQTLATVADSPEDVLAVKRSFMAGMTKKGAELLGMKPVKAARSSGKKPVKAARSGGKTVRSAAAGSERRKKDPCPYLHLFLGRLLGGEGPSTLDFFEV